MQYLGGKSRLAPRIAAALLMDTTARGRLLDPMVGGGSMLAQFAGKFATIDAGDAQRDLVMLWEALQTGWEPPREVSEEQWRELRDSEPSALRAFAGFGCSFGGRFFEGYARSVATSRNFARDAANRLAPIAERLRASPVRFEQRDYADWTVSSGDVVYLDPPYAGTKPYTAARSGLSKFDHARFWAVAEDWRSRGAHVYVSEFYGALDDLRLIHGEESVSVTGVGATALTTLMHNESWKLAHQLAGGLLMEVLPRRLRLTLKPHTLLPLLQTKVIG